MRFNCINRKKMKELIEKYFSDNLSSSEKLDLSNLLKDKENRMLFKEYVRVHYALNITLQKVNLDEQYLELTKTIKQIQKPTKSFYTAWYKYAAILISIIGITYFFVSQNKTSDLLDNQLIIADGDITLELENGNVKVVDVNGNEKIINKSGKIVGTQKGNSINYINGNEVEELVYNKLSIPNGKKFQIILSDGTKVHLNSGTSIKYPVKFIKGQDRQVYLLEGEAYFAVAKDTEHPFIVNSDNINVRVLGTEFNISSYPEDNIINTVLVEGSVSIFEAEKSYNKDTSIKLKPGFKASWNKVENKVAIDRVEINTYIGWINGKLIFKNTQFKNIIKKLERHYNITITNNNAKLNEQYFDATFDIETIDQVLNSFNKSYKIQYKIENNQIYIN